MANLSPVTDEQFEVDVLQADTPVLVDFWAEWCQPCKMIAPIVEELAGEFDGKIKFAKMDVDSNPKTPMNYGIRGIPTLIIFQGGQAIDQLVGALPKATLKKRLETVLEKA
ncbi:thioredoxin [SAR202 cluster bacterium AD-802-E10_MRT_200m]|nr:thioredoxin [SAR202 cluster bacterium AD-802-E10_MRT_200m]